MENRDGHSPPWLGHWEDEEQRKDLERVEKLDSLN